jgi:hypothetical protein
MGRSFWPNRIAHDGSSVMGNGRRSSGRYGVEQRGVWPNEGGEKQSG